MRITGTRGYIDVEYNGRTARFSGDMCIDGFAAIENSIKWIPPHESLPVTEKDLSLVMNAVREEVKNNKYKVFFTNDKYEDIDF